jgi:hypothetical protein
MEEWMAEAWISLAPDLERHTLRVGEASWPFPGAMSSLRLRDGIRILSAVEFDGLGLGICGCGLLACGWQVQPRRRCGASLTAIQESVMQMDPMDGANIYHRFHRAPRGAQIGVWVCPAKQGSKLPWLALASRQPFCDVGCRGMNLDRLSSESY